MAKRSKVYPVQIPPLPLRPGRPAFSRRTRVWLLAILLLTFLGIIAAGAVLARNSSKARVVTIPIADRSASPALIRAAEAVRFQPTKLSGAGQIEDKPASEALELTSGLLPVGARAPDFTLRTPTGKPVSLRSLRGKAVLLEFFATWCPHCAAEAPHLRDLYLKMPRKDVAFVAVDGNSEDAPSVLAYHIYFDSPFPAVLDPADRVVTFPEHGTRGPLTLSYRVPSYPTFYVLDRNGRVTWRSAGEQPDALLARELRRAARPVP